MRVPRHNTGSPSNVLSLQAMNIVTSEMLVLLDSRALYNSFDKLSSTEGGLTNLVAFSNEQLERYFVCERKEREFLCEKVQSGRCFR